MSANDSTRVQSASYAPCPNCREGTLSWDGTAEATRCVTCEEVV